MRAVSCELFEALECVRTEFMLILGESVRFRILEVGLYKARHSIRLIV